MKKVFTIVAVVLGLNFTAKAQEVVTPPVDANASEIKFESEVIDYGVIAPDANTEREFKLKNTGKTPLIISDVKAECGCTTVDGFPKEPIAPGKTAVIKVKYDAKNRPGQFNKKITVTSNSKTPTIYLYIKGNVKAAAPAPAAPANK